PISSASAPHASSKTAHIYARIAPHPARRVGALKKCVHAVMVLERIARRQQPPDAGEPQALEREQADGAMRRMRRIERAAEQPDAHAVGVERDGARRRESLVQRTSRMRGELLKAASARCRARDI